VTTSFRLSRRERSPINVICRSWTFRRTVATICPEASSSYRIFARFISAITSSRTLCSRWKSPRRLPRYSWPRTSSPSSRIWVRNRTSFISTYPTTSLLPSTPRSWHSIVRSRCSIYPETRSSWTTTTVNARYWVPGWSYGGSACYRIPWSAWLNHRRMKNATKRGCSTIERTSCTITARISCSRRQRPRRPGQYGFWLPRASQVSSS